jgi:hypothetical protein
VEYSHARFVETERNEKVVGVVQHLFSSREKEELISVSMKCDSQSDTLHFVTRNE